VLVSATTTTADLSMDEQKRLVSHVESAIEAAAAADAEVLFTGVVFFAHAGTESAKSEISLIGTGSVTGIVMLMIAAFRSLRPLYLALASIGCGCALAFTVTMWTFGSIHLTTLVFGAALVGVSVDYALHYLSHELLGPA